MSVRRLPLFLLIGALSAAAPALAQVEAPAAAPADAAAPAAEEPISPEEAAFNERSAELGRRVLVVDEEMKSAARLAALDPAVAKTALDDLQAGFQAEMEAFIQDFFSLAAVKLAALPEDEQSAFRTNIEQRAGELLTLPQAMRDRAEAAALLPPPSQTEPATN